MNVNIDCVDTVRNYWITDPMAEAPMSEPLSCQSRENCVLNPDGSIEENIASGSDAKVVYLGNMLNIWGHCITDNLKKLWFLKTPEYKELKSQGYTLCCTLHGDKKEFCKNFCDLLSYL
ncbi:MAG: hypothetical protein Q4B58_07590, partial [Bacteroidales bacterium]|nr:hypothetical protein [Bacteroidales bacterium]